MLSRCCNSWKDGRRCQGCPAVPAGSGGDRCGGIDGHPDTPGADGSDYLALIGLAACASGGPDDIAERLWSLYDDGDCTADDSDPCPFGATNPGDVSTAADDDAVEVAVLAGAALQSARFDSLRSASDALRAGRMQGGPGRRNGGAEPLECGPLDNLTRTRAETCSHEWGNRCEQGYIQCCKCGITARWTPC